MSGLRTPITGQVMGAAGLAKLGFCKVLIEVVQRLHAKSFMQMRHIHGSALLQLSCVD